MRKEVYIDVVNQPELIDLIWGLVEKYKCPIYSPSCIKENIMQYVNTDKIALAIDEQGKFFYSTRWVYDHTYTLITIQEFIGIIKNRDIKVGPISVFKDTLEIDGKEYPLTLIDDLLRARNNS